MILQRYGAFWRSIHKTIHNILNIKAAVTYVPYQDLENKIMLQGLLDEPQALLDHIRRYTFSLSTQIIFGYRSPSVNDPNLQQLFSVRGCDLRCGKQSNPSEHADFVCVRVLSTGASSQAVLVHN